MKSIKTQPIVVQSIFITSISGTEKLMAELRQQRETVTTYPNSSPFLPQDNLFGDITNPTSERTYKKEENRVLWIDVPEGTTELDLEFKMLSYPNATIYKILSNKPILLPGEDEDAYEYFASRQVVRYGESSDTPHKLILDKNNKIQYRRVLLSLSGEDDQDLRTQDRLDQYVPEYLQEEMKETLYIRSLV